MSQQSCLFYLAFVLAALWSPTVPASELPQEFASTMLATAEGKKLKAGDLLKPGRPTLLAFLGADCPLSQIAITGIPEALRKVSAQESVAVAGILVARDDAATVTALLQGALGAPEGSRVRSLDAVLSAMQRVGALAGMDREGLELHVSLQRAATMRSVRSRRDRNCAYLFSCWYTLGPSTMTGRLGQDSQDLQDSTGLGLAAPSCAS